MVERSYKVDRRKALGITAGTILANGTIIKSVSAQNSAVSRVKEPLLDISLRYKGDLKDTTDVETECGSRNHVVHESGLYIGDVDPEPYMSRSVVALVNSKIEKRSELFGNTPDNALPLEDTGGIGKRMKLRQEFKHPRAAIKSSSKNKARITIGGEEINISGGETKSLDLDTRTVEVRKAIGKTKNIDVNTKNMELKQGVTPPDTVSVEKTRLEQIEVTPSIQITHHGLTDIYGMKNGIVLPNDDRLSAVQRAKEQGAIKSNMSGTGKNIIIIKRGEN